METGTERCGSMIPKISPTTLGSAYQVSLFIAGDVAQAKQIIRKAVYPPNAGLCVTVTPTTFIYTGGEEEGMMIGFVNYPRFPVTARQIYVRAVQLAEELIRGLCQKTALIVDGEQTCWLRIAEDSNTQEK